MKMVFKQCFVPSCNASEEKTPQKLFLGVPRDINRRKQWFAHVSYDSGGFLGKKMYICEDHFDVSL